MTFVAGSGVTPAIGVLVLGAGLLGGSFILLCALGGAYLNPDQATRQKKGVIALKRLAPALFLVGLALLIVGVVVK